MYAAMFKGEENMMELPTGFIKKFEESNAWDWGCLLPTCLELNNPWIYAAYAKLNCDLSGQPTEFSARANEHFYHCETQHHNGLFYRWPHKRGGDTSHDEIIGAAYLSSILATNIYRYLEIHKWQFNNQNRKGKTLEFWMGRFIFLKPYLKARGNYKVNIFDQIIWSISLIASLINKPPGDGGGRLRNWLMSQEMKRFLICRVAINIWKKNTGLSPKEAYALELPRYPVYQDTAPDKW